MPRWLAIARISSADLKVLSALKNSSLGHETACGRWPARSKNFIAPKYIGGSSASTTA
jgi:hypothetical protein